MTPFISHFLLLTAVVSGIHLQAQNVGIRTTTPTAPLSFGTGANAYGHQLVVHAAGNTPVAAIGANNFNMYYSIADPEGSFVFGTGRSGAFSEVMRITAAGQVGIGTNSPTAGLDVGSRMRLRWFGAGETPGIWFPTQDQYGYPGPTYFLGMADNNSIHIIGNSKSVIKYNGPSKALAFNDSYGNAGDILVSGGKNGTAVWKRPSMPQSYSNSYELTELSPYTITTNNSPVTIAAFSQNLNYPGGARTSIEYNIATNSISCVACGSTEFDVEVLLNGNVAKRTRYNVVNGRTQTVHGSVTIGWAGGTLAVQVIKKSGPNLSLPVAAGRPSSLSIWSIYNQ